MITLHPYTTYDLNLIKTWISTDTVGSKYLDSYTTPEDWVHLVDNKQRFFYIAKLEDTPIGFFDFEIQGEKGYFSFYVAPEYRGKGLGIELLQTALNLDSVQQVGVLEGGVAQSNIASQKILERLGFQNEGVDDEGMLTFTKSQVLDKSILSSIEKHFNAQISNISELGKGACNTIFLLDIADKKYCLKIERPDKETDEENDIATEAKIVSLLNERNEHLHIPIVKQISEEHRFYIYTFFDGESLETYTKSNKSLRDLFYKFGVFHAQLDIFSKADALELGLTIDQAGTLHYNVHPFVEKERPDDLDWSQDWLDLIDCAHSIYLSTVDDAHFQLIHNDAHDKNIFIHQNDFCFIDFGDAMYGDVHAEFVSYMYTYPEYWENVIKGYEETSGITLNKRRLIAFSFLRYLKQFIKMWSEDTDRDLVIQKMEFYGKLLNGNLS